MRIFCLALAVFFSLPFFAWAGGDSVTLKEAISLALARNHLVKAAEFEQAAAGFTAAAGRGRFLPRIYLDESFTASNSPTRVFMMKLDQGRFAQEDFQVGNLNHPSTTADFRTALTLEQPLFDMDILYGHRMAESDAARMQLALERRKEEIAFVVFRFYLEEQQAKADLNVAENAVRDAREHVRLAQVRNDAGTGLKSDVLRALAFLAEMEQQEITARNDVLLAAMRLALATGGKPGEMLHISGTVKGMPLTMQDSEIIALAMTNRKDLRELEKEAEKSALSVKRAGSAFLPTLYGRATWQMNDRDTPFSRDNDAWLAGVNLRWDLFDGFQRFDERQRAAALHQSAREYVKQQSREISLQVRESLLRREEAAKKLEVARVSGLHAAEAVRLTAKRFDNSLATMVELLDAQTSLNRARANVVKNEAEYALATARTWYSAGIFLQEVMK